MERYICIHGHFYQPPRENPWLEAIEIQDSAYPYHDWNARIAAECYVANAAARILDGDGQIAEIVNNYASISFNFGPTLLAWMDANAPEGYEALREADQQSQQRFSGHGSALAQIYNHVIMPLANRRDKVTEVRWGIADFVRRFGRVPEGMWLSETAVDIETLEILAEHGIRFTILSPYQAGSVRKLGTGEWQSVEGGHIDPKMPYIQCLPSGRSIALFFYDGPISQGIAFEGLLASGERFTERLLGAFTDSDGPQLVHIATDGETYGHHHKNGEMALAYALKYIEDNQLAHITNYGEYLEKFPPTHEVQIIERTAWSCVHGVERWNSDCGCNSGGHDGWNQGWRQPLRNALDWLRDELTGRYEADAGRLLKDVWAARDEYINVILDRSAENVDAFLARHATHDLSADEVVEALKMLELQRYALLMYTSCGWFFDELSGIETVQVIQYAGRVVQIAQERFADVGNLEEQFLARLELAQSNIPDHTNGRIIYEKFVRPAMIQLPQVAAHYGMSALFEPYPDQALVYCYNITRRDYHTAESGVLRMLVAQLTVTSQITRKTADLTVAAMLFGGHNLTVGVRDYRGDGAYAAMKGELLAAFESGDLSRLVRCFDTHYTEHTYSLNQLFRDEQHKILNQILLSARTDAEVVYSGLYERHAPLLRYLANLQAPLPASLMTAAGFALNAALRTALESNTVELEHIKALLDAAAKIGVQLDTAGLAYAIKQSTEPIVEQFRAQPEDMSLLEAMEKRVSLAASLPFPVDLWRVQNIYYALLHTVSPQQRNETDQQWADRFLSLGKHLKIRVPQESVA